MDLRCHRGFCKKSVLLRQIQQHSDLQVSKRNAEVSMLETSTGKVAYGQDHSRPDRVPQPFAATFPLKPNVPRPSLSSFTSTWPKQASKPERPIDRKKCRAPAAYYRVGRRD